MALYTSSLEDFTARDSGGIGGGPLGITKRLRRAPGGANPSLVWGEGKAASKMTHSP